MQTERDKEIEEHLEALWCLKEEREDSVKILQKNMGNEFSMPVLQALSTLRLVSLADNDAKIVFTNSGEEKARRLIRSHRLAERMVHDVLGGEFEAGACEFEHIANPELVNSICTMLGHPRECPHGMPIPEGKCCKKSLRSTESSVIPLTEMQIGQSARVAYINCKDDRRLHKLNGLQIKPGAVVRLHQTYPTFVVECEDANIALDEAVSADICVWRDSQTQDQDEAAPQEKSDNNLFKRGKLFWSGLTRSSAGRRESQ